MRHTKSIRITLAAATVAITTAGCGSLVERATEEAVERAVESESGEDVEVDFSDGEIRVESEDGEITFNADEDGVQIEGTDADGNDFSLDADEEGVDIEGEDGSSLNIDDDGSFVATDDEGNTTTGEATDEGFTTFDENGVLTSSSGPGVLDEWPSDVPLPSGYSDVTHTYFAADDIVTIQLIGYVDTDAASTISALVADATAAGFEFPENPDGIGIEGITIASGTRGDEALQLASTDDSDDPGANGRTGVSITYGLLGS